MSMPISRSAFEQLVAEDLEWLMRQPRTLERDHIAAILKDQARLRYEAHPIPPVIADWKGPPA